MGPIGRPETSVRNYHYTLRSSLEERNSHLLRSGSLKSLKVEVHIIHTLLFFERFIAKKVYTECLWTIYKMVPPTNFNKYLYSGKSKIKINIYDSRRKFLKKHCD